VSVLEGKLFGKKIWKHNAFAATFTTMIFSFYFHWILKVLNKICYFDNDK
jgi:hypothetical protein